MAGYYACGAFISVEKMYYLHKGTSAVSCVKPDASQWEATLLDVVRFPTVYRRIYSYHRKFFMFSKLMSHYICKCIRMCIHPQFCPCAFCVQVWWRGRLAWIVSFCSLPILLVQKCSEERDQLVYSRSLVLKYNEERLDCLFTFFGLSLCCQCTNLVKRDSCLWAHLEHEMLKVSYCGQSVCSMRRQKFVLKAYFCYTPRPVDLKFDRKQQGDL